VFEKRVLMRIFGPKRKDVTKCWGKLHDDEISKIVLNAKQNHNDEIKEGEVGSSCSTNGR
jgi:hypothetical protein